MCLKQGNLDNGISTGMAFFFFCHIPGKARPVYDVITVFAQHHQPVYEQLSDTSYANLSRIQGT